jgi:molybdenum cofactor synthesis domain-containing protein
MAARRAHVLTVSTRAAAGSSLDTSGPVLASGLVDLGFEVSGPEIVADGRPVSAALRAAVGAGHDLVVTTGGTGLSSDDLTPEQTRQVIDREVPGIAEALRSHGAAAGVPTAMLSRGIAGVAGKCLIVNVAGSLGAAHDAIAVLGSVLNHAVDQVRGGDHPATGTSISD